MLPIQCAGTELILDADRAIYWPEKEILFLSDLHLGKVGHFHKEGIAIPGQLVDDEYKRLDALMQRYAVNHWICLGDLFHSHWNQEIPLFLKWKEAYPHLSLTLVEGNHDRYMRKHYASLNMDIVPDLILDPFYLVHDWKKHSFPGSLYALSGHLHPSIRLHGKGRQTMKLPCFYFQETGAYLPAFGHFTGSHSIEPMATDKIYAIAEDQVWSVKN